MMIQQQLIQQNNVENELTQLRQQAACAQQLVSGYEGRINELSGQLRDYERRIGEYVWYYNFHKHKLLSIYLCFM